MAIATTFFPPCGNTCRVGIQWSAALACSYSFQHNIVIAATHQHKMLSTEGVSVGMPGTRFRSWCERPGPAKTHKTFGGPKGFFLRSCPSHIFEPLVPRKPTKLSEAPKVFSAILSQSHIRTPGPTKADKTFRGPKSFFCDPVPVTYSNPFPGPQKCFLRSCPRHIFEPMVPQKPTKLSGAPKVLLRTHALGQTPTSQPDLPTLIISYFSLNSPEVQFRIPKLKLRPPKYYNFTRSKSEIFRKTPPPHWDELAAPQGPGIFFGFFGLFCFVL